MKSVVNSVKYSIELNNDSEIELRIVREILYYPTATPYDRYQPELSGTDIHSFMLNPGQAQELYEQLDRLLHSRGNSETAN